MYLLNELRQINFTNRQIIKGSVAKIDGKHHRKKSTPSRYLSWLTRVKRKFSKSNFTEMKPVFFFL